MPPKVVKKGKKKLVPKAPAAPVDLAALRADKIAEIYNHSQYQFLYDNVAHPQHTDIADKVYCSIRNTDDKGRILIADMDYYPGDIIFREKPLACADWHDFHCIECKKPHKSTRCNIVKSFYPSLVIEYLSDIEDALTSYDIVGDLDRARLFIKIICMLHIAYDSPVMKQFMELTTSSVQKEKCIHAIQQIRTRRSIQRSGLFPDTLSSETAGHVLAILNNNSHEIEGLGSGIFLYSAMLEHSCNSNCNFITTSTDLTLVALKYIPAGTSLTIDYNSAPYKPTAVRQRAYQDNYGFKCTCPQCTTQYDKSRAFNCPRSIRYMANMALAQQQPGFTYENVLDQATQQHQHHTEQYNHSQEQQKQQQQSISFDNISTALSENNTILQPPPQVSETQSFLRSSYVNKHIQYILQPGTFYSSPDICTRAYDEEKKQEADGTIHNPTQPCIDGIVWPIGDGTDPSLWYCSGCGYKLTQKEAELALQFEAKIAPPPECSADTDEERKEVYDIAGYTLPSLDLVMAGLSVGIVHWSHSSIFWTLYVIALDMTKLATNYCDIYNTQQQQQYQRHKKGGHTNNSSSPYSLTTIQQQHDKQQRYLLQLPFWSTQYIPGSSNLPKHIEYSLLAEHLWSYIIDCSQLGLQRYHPDKLIYYDYLAQINVIKGHIYTAKQIWQLSYQTSCIVNSPYTKETLKIKKLAFKTPHNLHSLQFHYNQINELMDNAMYSNDNETIQLLKLFSESTINDDEEKLNNKLLNNKQQEGTTSTTSVSSSNDPLGDIVALWGFGGSNNLATLGPSTSDNTNTDQQLAEDADDDEDEDEDDDDDILQRMIASQAQKASQNQKRDMSAMTVTVENNSLMVTKVPTVQQQQQQSRQYSHMNQQGQNNMQSNPQNNQLVQGMMGMSFVQPQPQQLPPPQQQPQQQQQQHSSFGALLSQRGFGYTTPIKPSLQQSVSQEAPLPAPFATPQPNASIQSASALFGNLSQNTSATSPFSFAAPPRGTFSPGFASPSSSSGSSSSKPLFSPGVSNNFRDSKQE